MRHTPSPLSTRFPATASRDLLALLERERTEVAVGPGPGTPAPRFHKEAASLVDHLRDLAGAAVYLVGDDPGTTIVALATLDRLGCTTILAPAAPAPGERSPRPGPPPSPHEYRGSPTEGSSSIGEIRSFAATGGELRETTPVSAAVPVPEETVGETSERAAETGGRLVLHTSGTTGAPRPVAWSWRRLLAAPDRDANPGATDNLEGACFGAYPLDTFAGIQSLVFTLGRSRALVFPAPGEDPLETLIDRPFTLAMATPTFWRRILLLADRSRLERVRIGTVSMGGEAADQPLLDDLARTWPSTRVVHVYASTELGSLFSVADGRAGFPAAWLGRPRRDGWRLERENDELILRRGAETRTTGDRIEVRGERAFFAGRRGEGLSVAGRTIDPLGIEAVLRRADGVADLRVYGHPSPITGAVVAVDVVLAPGADGETTLAALRALARERLGPAEVPRRWSLVDDLPRTRSGKLRRTPAPSPEPDTAPSFERRQRE